MRHSYVVAHPDDDLVFMSPTLLDVLSLAHPVQVIYLTAGDAGQDAAYWGARERGIVAAYAAATHGEPASFTTARHDDVVVCSSQEQHVTLAFLRLPDGMLDGRGSSTYGNESLTQLWEGALATIASVDGHARYTQQRLSDLISACVSKFAPDVLHTLNPAPLPAGEHADHRSAALFALRAWKRLTPRPAIRFYMGSNSPSVPANVDGAALNRKKRIFHTYAAFDSAIAATGSIYEPMLEREYSVDGGSWVESPQTMTT